VSLSGIYPPLFHVCGRERGSMAEDKENRNVKWTASFRVDGTDALRYSLISYLKFRSSPIRIYGYCHWIAVIFPVWAEHHNAARRHLVCSELTDPPSRSCFVTHACFPERSVCLECFLPILLSRNSFPLTLKQASTSGYFSLFPDINIIF